MRDNGLDAGALGRNREPDPEAEARRAARIAARNARENDSKIVPDATLPNSFPRSLIGHQFDSEAELDAVVFLGHRADNEALRGALETYASNLATVSEIKFFRRSNPDTNTSTREHYEGSVIDFSPSIELKLELGNRNVICIVALPDFHTRINIFPNSTIKVENVFMRSDSIIYMDNNEDRIKVAAIEESERPPVGFGGKPVSAWDESLATIKGSVCGAFCGLASGRSDVLHDIFSRRDKPSIKPSKFTNPFAVETMLQEERFIDQSAPSALSFLSKAFAFLNRPRKFEAWKAHTWKSTNFGGHSESMEVFKAEKTEGPVLIIDKKELWVGIMPSHVRLQDAHLNPNMVRLDSFSSVHELKRFLNGFRTGFGVAAFAT